jgi:hypothetical protein
MLLPCSCESVAQVRLADQEKMTGWACRCLRETNFVLPVQVALEIHNHPGLYPRQTFCSCLGCPQTLELFCEPLGEIGLVPRLRPMLNLIRAELQETAPVSLPLSKRRHVTA